MMSWIRKCTDLSAQQLRRFRNIMRPLSYLLLQDFVQTTQHKYWLFLPMRNTITSLKIGVPSSYELPKHDSDFDRNGVLLNGKKPIVWYGTSIVQGGAVSRPGSTFTNILSRELGRHVLNYGFAGNGIMEISVAKSIVTIDASLFVIDCYRIWMLRRLRKAPFRSCDTCVISRTRRYSSRRSDYGDYWISNVQCGET